MMIIDITIIQHCKAHERLYLIVICIHTETRTLSQQLLKERFKVMKVNNSECTDNLFFPQNKQIILCEIYVV